MQDPGIHTIEPPAGVPCFGVLTDEQQEYLRRLREEHSSTEVLAHLDALESIRVLVVGEVIIDEYHYCVPDAMSNKTPALSARFESEEVFAGGVVPVANHLAGLCAQVSLLACTGTQDERTEVVRSNLLDGVGVAFVARPDAPTVRKRRFVHRLGNQKLFEVTFLNDRPITPETERRFIAAIDRYAPQVDVVVVLDFGHGYFTPDVVENLRARSSFLAVNAQINSSNRGFNSIRKYKGADFISVDEYEIRLPFGERYAPLEDVILALGEESGCRRINVTQGDRGTHYFDGQRHYRAPILTNQVVDTMGAGDALLAASALMVQSGAPSELVPFVGNCMGGLMAQIVGHRTPVDALRLQNFISTLLE